MSFPSQQSHFEDLQAEEKRVSGEAGRLAAAMKDQEKAQVKKLGEVHARLEKLREERDRLRVEHDRVLGSAAEEERARLQAENVSESDLKAGRCTAEEYLARHLEPAEIDRKAKEVAAGRVEPIFKALRSVALDVLRLEVAEAETAAEVEYCRTSPVQAHVEALKAMLKTNEAKAGLVFGRFAAALTARDDLRRRLGVAEGGNRPDLGGIMLANLGLAELEALKFDPIITDVSLPELDELIRRVRAGGPGAQVAILNIAWESKFGTVRVDGGPARVKK